MEIILVQDRNELLIYSLFNIWKSSVVATHDFLTKDDIDNIAKCIPDALKGVDKLIIAIQNNEPIAFMGVAEHKLEMLFVLPKEFGKGVGRNLIEYAIKNLCITEVGVNEQNPKAKGFYEHIGFRLYKRTDLDEQGNPYPILYMKLAQ